jgi:hypothetical protein
MVEDMVLVRTFGISRWDVPVEQDDENTSTVTGRLIARWPLSSGRVGIIQREDESFARIEWDITVDNVG